MITLPSGWERCKLPDIAHIVMGQSPDSKTYNHNGDGLPFFQGKAEFGDLFPTINLYCSQPNKIARQGATLLSVRAPVGPTNLAKHECCIGRGLAAFHPCGGIEPKFLLHLFRSMEPVLSGKGTGSTFKAVTKGFVEGLECNLPPLNEQRRIVAKIEELFSELDKGVESLEKAREQLKIYRQAVLKHAFEGKLTAKWREENQDKSGLEDAGWQFVTLHEIAEINPRLDKSAYTDGLTVSFVPMLAVEAGTGVIDVSHVRPFHEVKKGYTHFQENDVLFAKITPCMENGKMAVVPFLKNKIGFGSTEFHVLRTSNRVSEQYIFYFVSSEQFRKNAEHNMTGAVGQRRVPATWLANEYVPLPPLPEQRIIVARIEKSLPKITRLLKETDAQLIKTKSLRQSILKRAFSGKLVAQDPNDEPASVLLERIRAE